MDGGTVTHVSSSYGETLEKLRKDWCAFQESAKQSRSKAHLARQEADADERIANQAFAEFIDFAQRGHLDEPR